MNFGRDFFFIHDIIGRNQTVRGLHCVDIFEMPTGWRTQGEEGQVGRRGERGVERARDTQDELD